MLFGVAGSCLSVEGSLSGLQLLNLTSDCHKHHQQVLHIGCVPPHHHRQRHLSSSGLSHLCGVNDSLRDDSSSSDAFTFTCGSQDDSRCDVPSDNAKNTVKLSLQMASVTYLHIPQMLHELALCVSDFRVYFLHITDSLRTAAADLAMGLVMNKHANILSAVSMYGSSWGLDVGHRGARLDLLGHERGQLTSENDTVAGLQFAQERSKQILGGNGAAAVRKMNLLLDAVLESPVVMLPRSAGSSEVLSLQLGKIVISNKHDHCVVQNVEDFSDVMSIEIRNISMCSTDLDKLQRQQQQQTSVGYQLNHDIVMVHDTSVEMKLHKKCGYLASVFSDLYANIADDETVFSVLDHLEVTGTVVTPLHIVLTKHHYEQILNTLDNILLPDDVLPASCPSDVKQNECGVSAAQNDVLPGVSPLICDELLGTKQTQLAEASSLPSRPDLPLIVCGSFSLPLLIIQMRADFADGNAERDIVALRLDGFEVSVVAQKWFKAFDFQLQVIIFV